MVEPPWLGGANIPRRFPDFDGLLEHNPLPHLILTHGGFVRALNPAAERLLGEAASEIVGRPFGNLMDEPEAFRFMKFLQQAERLQITLEGHFELLLGKDFVPIQIYVTPSKIENVVILSAVVLPLRSHPASQPWLRQPQRSEVIDAIDGIVWEATVPLRFTFISRQVEHILGYPARSWIAEPRFWEEHIHPDDRDKTLRARHQAARKGVAHVMEYRMFCADRRVISVKDSAVVKQSAEDLRLIGIITDITELRTVQEELRKSNQRLEQLVQQRTKQLQQNLETMESFCYGIAHDLRAPARTIQSFVALLVSDHAREFDATGHDYANRITAACKVLDKLIQDLLLYGTINFSRLELRRVELQPAVQEVVGSLREEIRTKRARLDVSGTLPCVTGDPDLLRRTLFNLLSNALKFTRGSSRPEITIRAQVISEKSRPAFVRLTVTDNGIGISPDMHPRIFGVFQRGHHPSEFPGTGVGLAIVKRAIELMNGRVGVYSEPGQGSSFWIELPAGG